MGTHYRFEKQGWVGWEAQNYGARVATAVRVDSEGMGVLNDALPLSSHA